MTRYFFDTEFDEDGKTIELISIGIKSDDGREYYAVSREFDPLHCNDWVKQNVLTRLPPPGDSAWKWRAQIRDEVEAFVAAGAQLKPEFWAYYADYDWVVLCQLFGKMIDLPAGWPMYCRDLKQLADHYGILSRDLPKQDDADEHHALYDARWCKEAFDFIESFYFAPGKLFRPDPYGVWENGYEHGRDDSEKTDCGRADVIKTENPYPAPLKP